MQPKHFNLIISGPFIANRELNNSHIVFQGIIVCIKYRY